MLRSFHIMHVHAVSVIAAACILLGICEAYQQAWSLGLDRVLGAGCEHDVSVCLLLGCSHKAQRGRSCSITQSVRSFLICAHATLLYCLQTSSLKHFAYFGMNARGAEEVPCIAFIRQQKLEECFAQWEARAPQIW